MVEISLYGSGEGPGWVTAPGYSTAPFRLNVRVGGLCQSPVGSRRRGTPPVSAIHWETRGRPTLPSSNGPRFRGWACPCANRLAVRVAGG